MKIMIEKSKNKGVSYLENNFIRTNGAQSHNFRILGITEKTLERLLDVDNRFLNYKELRNFNDNIDLLSKKYKQSSSLISKKIEKNNLIKKLRNKYFHFSACASIGYIPKYSYSKVDYGNYKYEVNRKRLVIVK